TDPSLRRGRTRRNTTVNFTGSAHVGELAEVLIDGATSTTLRGRAAEVLAVFGPTATGKTAVAQRLADELATEVVSADALQVYRGLTILTNQPSRPTRLVGIRDLSETMSVGEYARLAHDEIDTLVARTGGAVVAGGTGLYLRAALSDLAVPPAVPSGERE